MKQGSGQASESVTEAAPARAAESTLPETGFLRIWQIIGDPKASPPVPGLIPVGRTSWWNGVRAGRYPKPVSLGPSMTAWRVEDIRALIQRLSDQAAA
jgi:predicted DNA-binding transcriptional regulator AlpA